MTLTRKINLHRVFFTLKSKNEAEGAHFVTNEPIPRKGFSAIVENCCSEVDVIQVTKRALQQANSHLNKRLDKRFGNTQTDDYFLIGNRVVERDIESGEIAVYSPLGSTKTRGERMIRYLENNFPICLARHYREEMQESIDFRKSRG
jgi:hypothetical protein